MPDVRYSTVECTERAGSRTETFDGDSGLVCNVDLYFDWNKRYDLMDDLIRGRHQWPYLTTTPNFLFLDVIPTRISCKPIPQEDYTSGCQGIDHVSGIASVEYKTWSLVRESVEFQTQAIRLEPKLFKWKSTNVVADDQRVIKGIEGLSQVVNRLILVREYEIDFVPPFNFYGTNETGNQDARSGFTGTVHDKSYQSTLIQLVTGVTSPDGETEFVSFPADTLLLLDPIITPAANFSQVAGVPPETPPVLQWQRQYKYKFRWLFRPEGHDKFWRAQILSSTANSRGGWDGVVIKDTAGDEDYIPFPSKDQTPLFVSPVSSLPIPNSGPCPIYNIP